MTYGNELGLQLTAANADAVAAFDRTIAEYLRFGRDTGKHLKAALTGDPDMPMAHVLRGYFFQLMRIPALLPKAGEEAAAAEKHADRVTARERLHIDALKAWCAGDFETAIGAWETILKKHPRDVLALKLASHLHFYLGDSRNVRDCVARVLPAWDESVPGYGYLLGMHAFGLEETGNYRAAERRGRKAVELNPEDAWAVHAVAHVLDSERRFDEGVEWIGSLEPHWRGANNFRYHLWWHRALMQLARGEHERVLELYDQSIWDPQSDEYLDLCNDAALLARLELRGVDVGDRWQALADKVEKQCDTRSLAFIDAHYALTLAAAGRTDRLATLLAGLKDYAGKTKETTARVTAEVGLPLCQAVTAWRAGDHARVCETLAPLRDRLIRIGGSHTQRDLFAQILAASQGAAAKQLSVS